MTQNADFFQVFDDHTRLKHDILDVYLYAWAMKLLQGRSEHVLFIDAFAGAGRDEAGNPGSPLIAARVSAAVNAALGLSGQPRRGMRVLAIEKHRRRFETLQCTLASFACVDPTLAIARHGELAKFADGALAQMGGHPVLTFLDPFGIQGLDATVYPSLLSGERNEVFALFADQGAVRLHGLITAGDDLDEQLEALRCRPSLFPEVDAELEGQIRARAEQRNRALELSQPAAREYLTRALGDASWADAVGRLPIEDRANKFMQLFIQRLLASGARYVIAIPMRNREKRRVYSLIHASKSRAGFRAMKEAVHTGLNRDTITADVRELIRQDLHVSTANLVHKLKRMLPGLSVPWTVDKGSREFCVRNYVLEQTAMFPFQLDELKCALADDGIIPRSKTGKLSGKLVCTFPRDP